MSAGAKCFVAGLCLLLPLGLGACSTAYFATSVKGTATSGIVPGVTAAMAEQTLGAPIREWRNPDGVTYRWYQIDGGRPPRTGDAAATAAFAILTFGMSEALFAFATKDDMRIGIPLRLIVSYDADGVVLGVFEEFDHLPADGRNGGALTRQR